jgi:hypothetical protein
MALSLDHHLFQKRKTEDKEKISSDFLLVFLPPSEISPTLVSSELLLLLWSNSSTISG